MRRRDFIKIIAGTASVWPLAAQAQQPTNLPVIGFLTGGSPRLSADAAFAQGLREAGYIERQNVMIEYRWARGAYERLPDLAAELIALRVDLIAAFGIPAARAAKTVSIKSTPAIPVVFSIGADPVAEGLVESLNRPGGNLTGVTSIASALASKRLELLREFLRDDAVIALLMNPASSGNDAERRDFEAAALAIGQRLEILTASNEIEIDAAFAALGQRRVGALIIGTDTYYFAQMQRLAALGARHQMPAIGPLREFAAEGGLLSYGANIFEVNRLAGIVAGKVLKGARPADLPVQQPTKFELVINLKTARALGLTVPQTLLATADEVIE